MYGLWTRRSSRLWSKPGLVLQGHFELLARQIVKAEGARRFVVISGGLVPGSLSRLFAVHLVSGLANVLVGCFRGRGHHSDGVCAGRVRCSLSRLLFFLWWAAYC